jgi:hypothetical protein
MLGITCPFAFMMAICIFKSYTLCGICTDFLIRINNGRISRMVLDMLLDERMTELDLVSCEFNEADYQHIAVCDTILYRYVSIIIIKPKTTCTKLKSLTLGATTDSIIRAIVTQNHNLEHLSIYCSSKFSQKVAFCDSLLNANSLFYDLLSHRVQS